MSFQLHLLKRLTQKVKIIYIFEFKEINMKFNTIKPPKHVFVMINICLVFLIFSFNVNSQSLPKNQKLEDLLNTSQLTKADSVIESFLAEKSSLTPTWQTYYLNRKSQSKLTQGLFQESLDAAKASNSIISKISESEIHGDTYRALCFAYIRVGKLDSALMAGQKLYELSKKLDNNNFRRASLMAMGNISLQNKKFTNSLEFYQEALELTQTKGDSLNLKVDMYNVGLAHSTLREFDKSNKILLQAADRAQKEGEKRLLARIYGTIADNKIKTKESQEQIYYLKKANEIAAEIGDSQLLAMGYANLMDSYLISKDFSEVIKLGKMAQFNLEKRPSIQIHAKVDSMLYIAYKNTQDMPNALTFLERYDEKKETIRSQNQKKILEELTLAFEIEKKDLLIQNQNIQLREEKTKANLYFVTTLALLAIIGLMVYMRIKNSKTRSLFFKKEKELDFRLEQMKTVKSESSEPESDIPSENLKQGLEEETKRTPNQMFGELLEIIEEKKLYLDPSFTQKSLVVELGTNRQYLYEAINSSGEENFRMIINRFRINLAKKMIETEAFKGERPTLVQLYESVGFNSYRSFSRVFKSITGLTPNEYLEEFNKHSNSKSA